MVTVKEQKDDNSVLSCEPQSLTVVEQSQGHNRWTPLDNYNRQYEEHLKLKTSQPHTKNHIHDNIVCLSILYSVSRMLFLTAKN